MREDVLGYPAHRKGLTTIRWRLSSVRAFYLCLCVEAARVAGAGLQPALVPIIRPLLRVTQRYPCVCGAGGGSGPAAIPKFVYPNRADLSNPFSKPASP